MAKIYWAIHGYPPRQNAGAEWMALEINNFLTGMGHEIYVHEPGDYLSEAIAELEPDIIITHLDLSVQATAIAAELGLPCINIVHHTFPISHLRYPKASKLHVVYNAQWVADTCKYPLPSSILHPPIDPSRFKNVPLKTGSLHNQRNWITLVNCNKDKGAFIFRDIARAIPNKHFLAVRGHHGPQINLRADNITQLDPTYDITTVFAHTGLLLVPSVYESYGRIAIEAMCCGIPVIATSTPGLVEALTGSDAKLIKSRNHVPAWIENIYRTVTDDNSITDRIAFAIAKWQQSLKELAAFNDLINSLVK